MKNQNNLDAGDRRRTHNKLEAVIEPELWAPACILSIFMLSVCFGMGETRGAANAGSALLEGIQVVLAGFLLTICGIGVVVAPILATVAAFAARNRTRLIYRLTASVVLLEIPEFFGPPVCLCMKSRAIAGALEAIYGYRILPGVIAFACLCTAGLTMQGRGKSARLASATAAVAAFSIFFILLNAGCRCGYFE